MKISQYDVFSGRIDRDAIWLETVGGLGAAIAKMKEYDKQSPGRYFVFCSKTHTVMASIHTLLVHGKDAENRESV